MSTVRTAWRWIGLSLVSVALVALLANPMPDTTTVATTEPTQEVERLEVEVLETYPHDTDAFTQGFELHDELLYESTGLYGDSDARIVEPQTGEVLHQVELPDSVFAEGMTVADGTVWQITWQEEVAFRRDVDTLEEIEQVAYTGEGWGICYDEGGDQLVMSDGSETLTFRDPETFDPLATVPVTRDGEPLRMLNELECVDGKVWANVWLTDEIVRIDPASGTVEATVDAAGLLTSEEQTSADVLNGIAAVPDSDTFLITGKLWPWTFLVRFSPARG